MKSRKRKNFMLLVVMVLATLMLVGCSGKSEKTPMTAKEFKNAMEEKGFKVVDQIESTNGDNAYQDVYVAYEDEKYSFEYYFMKDVDSAAELYAYATANLDANYKNDSSAVIVAKATDLTGKYEVSASDYYCVVWQNENAVLYLTAYSNCKEDAKTILKDLGYK